MTEGLRVETLDLKTKAEQLRNLEFTNSLLDKPIVVPPDLLPSSKPAVANLNENASTLYRFQDNGRQEGLRLAETLDSVAKAYDDVDAAAQAHLDGNGPAPEPVIPAPNTIPAPMAPQPMGATQQVSAGGTILVPKTQNDLATGDNAASLQQAAETWISNGNDLHASADKVVEPIDGWEGDAAQQAYAKFNKFGEWLRELGTAWHKLGGEAFELAEAHRTAMFNHTPIYQEYERLNAECQKAIAAGTTIDVVNQYAAKMTRLQGDSDSLREDYASRSARPTVTPPDAPPGNTPTAPVTKNGTRSANDSYKGMPEAQGAGGAGGGSGGGSGGASPAGDPTTAQTSPMSADPSQASKGSGESGSGSGGSPSGGGESGGSGSGGGMPGLPGGEEGAGEMPGLDDPRLSPAADLGGGGGGGSGGGGAGGGGAGAAPLQPSVNGVAVGPSPTAAGGSAGTATPTAASGGGMGGGMGGMAPMGGGHGAQQGGEKKRTPGLAPDEELYTEDRPHTEGIIGRPERRAGQGKKDST